MYVRQGNFAGGLISPTLWGRTDLAKYTSSLRESRNGFVQKHGAWMNRSGTRFVGEVKDSSRTVRLVPFNFANGQNFVLEFGHLYVRFWQNGGRVESPPGTAYEIVSPFSEGDLMRLKYAQIGDIITICHPSYAPWELRRYGNTDWRFALVDFTSRPGWTPGAPALDGTTLTAADPASGHYATEWVWAITTLGRASDGTTFETLPVQVAQQVTWGGAIYDSNKSYVLDDQFTYNGHLWKVKVPGPISGITPGGPGSGFVYNDLGASSGAPVYSAAPSSVVLFRDRQVKLLWNADGAPGNPGYQVIGYRIYRGRNGQFGYIGETSGTTSFLDDGTSPDYTNSPPNGRNPFQITDWQGNVTETENPAVVTFFEQRRLFANTPKRPSSIFLSRVGDFVNFDTHIIGTADDAFDTVCAAEEFEEIRNLKACGPLLALTNQRRWLLSGSAGSTESLTALSVGARSKGRRSSSWLDALVIDQCVLAMQANNKAIRELNFEANVDQLQGTDLTVMVPHLLDYWSIVDWAYAEAPFGIIWSVRGDGALLGTTYLREHQLCAWHRHDTLGAFERVCTIQEGDEDGVYVVVSRTINGQTKRYIERLTSRVLPRLEDETIDVKRGVFLDCSLSYDAAPATVFSGLDHLEGMQVTVLADGSPFGPYTVTNGQIDISADVPDGAAVVHAGLAYVSEMETLDLAHQAADISMNEKLVINMGFEVVDTPYLTLDNPTASKPRAWRASTGGAAKTVDGKYVAKIPGTYGRGGRGIARQTDPLPVTIVALAREVDLGGA